MSSSTYTFYPPGPDTEQQPRNTSPQLPQYLNPFSPQLDSTSSSPGLNAHTPADSVSTLSVHYQSSEFTEADDPFFGVSFDPLTSASPSFLDDEILTFNDNGPLADGLGVQVAPASTQHARPAVPYLPLSPDKSPSLPGGSPNGQFKDDATTRGMFPAFTRTSIAPQDLSLAHQSSHGQDGNLSGFQLTPKTSDSTKSSDDGAAPTTVMRSPRVTVSHWDRDYFGVSHAPNTNQPQGDGTPALATDRDGTGRWIPNQATGQGGLDPTARSTTQVESVNDLAAQRDLDERNQEVNEWLKRSRSHSTPHRGEQSMVAQNAPNVPNHDGEDDNIPQREISTGDRTENKQVPGQTYYVETGGALTLTHQDLEIMRQGHVWEDAPSPFSISQSNSTPYQPESSQAAIEKYQRMCRDNDSIVSRAATWGTRRLSLPSIMDAEVQVAGNLFKKLSLSRGDTRRPSILQNIRGLVRKPSINSGKRNRPDPDDASSFVTVSSIEKKENQAKLAPPSPKPGWSRKQSVPSINTAFLDVGNRIASLGTTHSRASSVSATPITSPKSPSGRNLSVKKPLNRLRSKSETSGIVDLWKRSGGPPVPNTKANAPEADDDDDDEDDLYEDGDMQDESNKLMDGITPNLAGFQQHVLKLNPLLADSNNYLVERIVHQQCHRYKNLLNLRVKHLQAVAARNCSCGSMCVAMGGSANILDSKGGERGLDPLSARYDGSDDQRHSFGSQSAMAHVPMPRQPGPMAYSQQTPPLGMYPIAPPSQGYSTANLYSPNFDGLAHGMAQAQINMSPMTHHHQHQNQLYNQHQHPQQHHGFQSLNSQAAFPNIPVTSSAGAYMSAPQANPNYMAMASELEPFPALDMNVLGLGLQDPTGAAGQMPYGAGGSGLVDLNMGLAIEQQHHHPQQQFTPHGSVSPFVRSPNAQQGGFYP
ncbi:hypothetical protein CHGG_01525 [Chaetomium globosum CBS 148.51]|uniref:Uncharacterized protein n=1 Tax=Chaetomium globosum (strain ATCC 6205 / CBS 148.51 / DSM 1962 / NBRC 6347 / NRRL 1970) TaxID=306901 RepID=Q2HE29_CHAGB|nr:uncharacterized protein CHGG_01525 [Chaetomium globosum CBS 148.51]EAQ93290.1 hypothetical protein CHGG_01525 [Chaetomium globosum CBS 148.51]